MKTVSVVEAQKQLPDLVSALKEGPVVLLPGAGRVPRSSVWTNTLTGNRSLWVGTSLAPATGPGVSQNQEGRGNSVFRNPEGSRQAASQQEEAGKAVRRTSQPHEARPRWRARGRVFGVAKVRILSIAATSRGSES